MIGLSIIFFRKTGVLGSYFLRRYDGSFVDNSRPSPPASSEEQISQLADVSNKPKYLEKLIPNRLMSHL